MTALTKSSAIEEVDTPIQEHNILFLEKEVDQLLSSAAIGGESLRVALAERAEALERRRIKLSRELQSSRLRESELEGALSRCACDVERQRLSDGLQAGLDDERSLRRSAEADLARCRDELARRTIAAEAREEATRRELEMRASRDRAAAIEASKRCGQAEATVSDLRARYDSAENRRLEAIARITSLEKVLADTEHRASEAERTLLQVTNAKHAMRTELDDAIVCADTRDRARLEAEMAAADAERRADRAEAVAAAALGRASGAEDSAAQVDKVLIHHQDKLQRAEAEAAREADRARDAETRLNSCQSRVEATEQARDFALHEANDLRDKLECTLQDTKLREHRAAETIGKLKAELLANRERLKSAENVAAQVSERVGSADARAAALHSRAEAAETARDMVLRELEDLRASHECALREARAREDRARGAQRKLEVELSACNDSLQRMKAQSARETECLRNAEMQAHAHRTRIQELQQAREATVREADDMRACLERTVRDAKLREKQASETNRRFETELASTRSRLQRAEAQIAREAERVREVEMRAADYCARIEELQQARETKVREAGNMRETLEGALRDATAREDKATEATAQAQEAIRKLTAELEAATVDRGSQRKCIADLTQRNATLKHQTDAMARARDDAKLRADHAQARAEEEQRKVRTLLRKQRSVEAKELELERKAESLAQNSSLSSVDSLQRSNRSARTKSWLGLDDLQLTPLNYSELPLQNDKAKQDKSSSSLCDDYPSGSVSFSDRSKFQSSGSIVQPILNAIT